MDMYTIKNLLIMLPMSVGILFISGCSQNSLATVQEDVGTVDVSEQETTIPTLLTTIDTANWRAYENDNFGINLKYPQNFFVYPPHMGIQDLEEYNVLLNIQYKYDLPKYESQYLGMANKVVSQESFDQYAEQVKQGELNLVELSNGYQAEQYIGGDENSILIEQYDILYNDYYVTVTASAQPILERLGLAAMHFGDSGILSSNTPSEIVEYFDTFDQIVSTIDLSKLKRYDDNINFSNAAEVDMEEVVFDGCGKADAYQHDDWFGALSTLLSQNGLAEEIITEMCFAAQDKTAIILAGAGYCKAGHVYKYSVEKNILEEAERLNKFFDCPTSPTEFNGRKGQIIEMKGVTGDGGCGAYSTFEYNYVTNQYRTSHTESMCDGDEESVELDY